MCFRYYERKQLTRKLRLSLSKQTSATTIRPSAISCCLERAAVLNFVSVHTNTNAGNKVDQMADAGKLPQGRKSRQSAEPPLPDPMDGLVKKKQKKKRPRSSTAVPAEPRNLNGQKMLKYLERPKMVCCCWVKSFKFKNN